MSEQQQENPQKHLYIVDTQHLVWATDPYSAQLKVARGEVGIPIATSATPAHNLVGMEPYPE